jgi:drug/metabolite transporter (DMT)-like permease
VRVNRGVFDAIAAAALFGASTPVAKILVGQIPPVLLAGLLYAGSGLGLGVALLVRHVAARRGGAPRPALPGRADLGWLAGAILFGGVFGPILLMLGLTSTAASVSALLLNLEAVFTAGLAWFAFHENFDLRIATGMGLIVIGGVVLSWIPGTVAPSPGAMLIAGACLCWAIDNNLTRKVSAGDAMTVACLKGLVAGVVNIGIAALVGAGVPPMSSSAAAGIVGLAGYGASLTLFVLALRELGTARTAAYFSVAPFFGALLAIPLNAEPLTWPLGLAGMLMAAGVWLHVTERHDHLHVHEALEHTHEHRHDEHHRHDHEFAWDGREPHTHAHVHAVLVHAHPHYPDVHHRHRHARPTDSNRREKRRP